MDRKSILILIASFGLLFAWQWAVPKWFPPVPVPKNTNALATAANVFSTNPASLTAAPTNGLVAVPAPVVVIDTNAPEQIEILETADGIYTFTSHGGGLKRVALKRFLETVGCDLPPGTNRMAMLNDHARVPVLAMQAEGALADNIFKLTRTSATSVTAEKTLPSGLRLIKQFDLGSNYQMTARVRVENATGQPVMLPAQQVGVGTATPMDGRDPMTMMGVFWFNGEKAEHIEQPWFDGGASCFKKEPRLEYSSGPNRILWAAVHNQFFTLAVVPATNAIGSQFTARRINLPPPTAAEIAADSKTILTPHGLEGAIEYPAVTLAANQVLERQFTIYAGPKDEKTLSRLGRGTVAIMDFGFFSPISKLMLRLMIGIHSVIEPIVPQRLGAYAMALVIMTILIKLLFWPLTQKSTKSMKRMQALSPELKKIQEKYKEDPMKMNKKVMEFWREHKVSPMSGCWPMLIQLPIFFALFRMIPNAIQLRGQPFLWACDLSKPDTVFSFLLPNPFTGNSFDCLINPLPLIMGVTMLIQARMQPAAPGMDPAQQKLMKYMPLIFLVFLYMQPAGLTLYWTVQNLLTIVQTKLINAQPEPVVTPVSAVTPVKPLRKKK